MFQNFGAVVHDSSEMIGKEGRDVITPPAIGQLVVIGQLHVVLKALSGRILSIILHEDSGLIGGELREALLLEVLGGEFTCKCSRSGCTRKDQMVVHGLF